MTDRRSQLAPAAFVALQCAPMPADVLRSAEAARAPALRTTHPPGLFLLFASEMWERMSYYGMRALLVLYMTRAVSAGGFGWGRAHALSLYGWYTGLVYLTPVVGGALADRVLGARRAVLLGGALMMGGHFLMAVPGAACFFVALGLLILGNGCFKPNISTMVGSLYAPGDARRDGAFTIFYMGINLGAFLAPLVCGSLGERIGFHWGFGSAGVGMAIGLTIFSWGAPKFLGSVGLTPTKTTGPNATAAAALSAEEKDRLFVILVLTFFTIFFWCAFEQAGGLMNLFTDEKIDRTVFAWTVPTSWFQMLNPLFILLFAPLLSRLWITLDARGRNPSIPKKMSLGMIILAVGFLFMMGAATQSHHGAKAPLLWIVGAYLFNTLGELCTVPIGLSMVTKLAPARVASLLMGTFLLASFLGNLAAGYVGGLAERLGEFRLFGAIFAATVAAGAVLLLFSPLLVRRMHGRG